MSDINADTDEDGLTNFEEVTIYGTNSTLADTNGDKLSDGDAIIFFRTNPTILDADMDGVTDGDEVKIGSNPLVLVPDITPEFLQGDLIVLGSTLNLVILWIRRNR